MQATASKQEVEKWDLFELRLNGPADGNPFEDVQLSARFQYKNRVIEPDGFYDGNGVYRIRFMPDQTGMWRYVTRSNRSELDGHVGEFVCTAPSADNHGPVRVKDSYLLEYEDGTPHFSFGTTCYHWTHHGNALEEEMTLRTFVHSPFNKVRMCILPTQGMHPPLLAFEGTEPDNIDRTKFNPAFFAHLEKRILDLMQIGIEADMILFHPYDKGYWGFDSMERETDFYYLKYVIARLAAFRNVWWSLSNEYDFNKFKTIQDWDRLLQFVQHHDPYQHLRSIHNGTKMYESSALFDFSKPWITHQSIQHWDAELTSEWRQYTAKPVVIDEISYEGNSSRRWGNVSGQELTHRFWEGFSRGGHVGHGESFIDRETGAWISRGGRLYGESQERIAFLRKIMEEGPADWIKAQEEGSYSLIYLGRSQPASWELDLIGNCSYRIDLLDTWEMTITPLPNLFQGKTRINLPGKPYLAVRIARAHETTQGGKAAC